MTTYTWPQTVNGVAFSAADFNPYGYVTSLPNLLGNFTAYATSIQALIASDRTQAAASATAAAISATAAAGSATAAIARAGEAATAASNAGAAATAAAASASAAATAAESAAGGGIKITAADTTPKLLDAAVTVSGAMVKSVTGPGGNEKLNLTVDLSAYATRASPALTGTPTVPTASAGANTNQIASTAFVEARAIAAPTTAEVLWTRAFV